MTKEELFKRNFPDYCRGDECLSPYFDMFEAGIEIATKEMDVKTIKPLQTQIEKMKSCDNCKYYFSSDCATSKKHCRDCSRKDKWELVE